jgi:cytochrome c551/c552
MKNTSILFTGFIFLLTIPLFASIGSPKPIQNNQTIIYSDETSDTKALALIHSKCFVCHNPDMKAETRLAPPMHMVRQHYYTTEISKAEFVDQITNFVMNPTAEKSVMPGAVRNFGLMPKSVFEESEVKIIAAYIFDNDLASDSWYKKWKKHKQTLQ